MTFIAHAYAGAVIAHTVCRLIGVDGGVIVPVCGAVLGSAPDTLDWIGAKLVLFPRWWLYNILHFYRPVVIVECILLFPGIHVLLDRLVHRGVESGGGIPDMEKYIIGEIMVWSVFTNILIGTWLIK